MQNIKTIFTALILPLFFQFSVYGQKNHTYKDYRQYDNRIEIQVNDGKYVIEPIDSFIIHTTFYAGGITPKNFSYAAVKKSGIINFSLINTKDSLTINTGGIRVSINKSPFTISYAFKQNSVIVQNMGEYGKSNYLNFSIHESEILYGGGARVLGMNRRGHKLDLYNRADYGYTTHSKLMNYSMPVFLSSKKYAVLFDNASKGTLDLDSRGVNEVKYSTVSGTLNYYIIAADKWFKILDEFTGLTGKQPLPPRWAFGNFSSRFGYHSQEEVLSTVNRFIEDSIPVDAVIIDIYWFGKGIFGDMGRLNWYRDSFPNPELMIDSLRREGVKTILVTEPFILTTSDRWDEAVENKVLCSDKNGQAYTYDFYFGNTGLIDVFDTTASNWFWNIYKGLINQGVEGIWGDLGEPEVHPTKLLHVNGSADEVHNAYGHKWTQIIYEGYQNDFPDKRPFILMRAGFAGTQRYGIIPWSGDVSRSWGGLVPQTEISLQMGLQGIAYMHSDLGGFAGGDSINNELYIRWLQYGVFQPIYRPHAQEQIPAEPVFYNEKTKNLARESIRLRYQLMPYIYNMAFQNSQTGKPLMIPLFFNDPNPNLLTYDHAYMFGDALLVSPVKEQGVTEQEIYFPAGNNWTDLYSGRVFKGGKTTTVAVEASHIPVFVKNGSFVPMKEDLLNTENYNLSGFTLHYYFDKQVLMSKYQLYNDDGKTPESFEKNQYEIFDFSVDLHKDTLMFSQKHRNNKWDDAAQSGKVKLIIHNLEKAPSEVYSNNKILNDKYFIWDSLTNSLIVNYTWSAQTVRLKICY